MNTIYERIAGEIGYRFRDIQLLKQAFTRKSFSAENGGENNEILEFIGDKALDLAVIRIITNYLGIESNDKRFLNFKLKNDIGGKTKSQEGIFTNIKSDIVRTKALSKCIGDKGFNEHLIMNKGDIIKHVEQEDSVKEDLFEAIIGAVAVDSDYDMDKITNVVETLIDFDQFFQMGYVENNPIGLLQEWCAKKRYSNPAYVYELFNDCFLCSVTIKELECFGYQWVSKGKNKASARSNAAEMAYKFLVSSDRSIENFEELKRMSSKSKYSKRRKELTDDVCEFISKNLEEGKIKEMMDFATKKGYLTNLLIEEKEVDCFENRDTGFNYECSITADEFADEFFYGEGNSKEEAYLKACKELLDTLLVNKGSFVISY